MQTSKINICNKALSLLGITRFISALTEFSEEAKICNLFYADSVRKCLCMYDWKFARVDRALQLVEVDEAYKLPNYSYYYVYPFDCLKERLLHSEGVEKGQEIKYLCIPEQNLKVIMSNEADLWLRYTVDLQDETQFPPLFENLVYKQLALDMTSSLRLDMPTYQRVEIEASRAIADAKNGEGADVISYNDAESTTLAVR